MNSPRMRLAIVIVALLLSPSTLLAQKKSLIVGLLNSPNVSSNNYALRGKAWLAIWKVAKPSDVRYLSGAARKHRSAHARRVAAEVLGKLKAKNITDRNLIVRTLCDVLKSDTDAGVRRAAAYAFGLMTRYGNPPTGSRLQSAMKQLDIAMRSDSDDNVRKRAAASLSLVAPVSSRKLLQKALKAEKSGAVKTAIEWSLKRPSSTARKLPKIKAGQVAEGICRGTRYLVYAPKGYRKSKIKKYPVLVSVHGSDGTPDGYLDFCRSDADKYGFLIVAPWFDFPTFDHWGSWGLRHFKLGRADQRLLAIWKDVGHVTPTTPRFYLYGHSQGGQFVHRFVMLQPKWVEKAAAAAPGDIVRPNPKRGFPHGTQFNSWLPDLKSLNFGALAKAQLAVVVGSKDDKKHRDLARELVNTARDSAKKHGFQSPIHYILVNNGPHQGKNNYLKGARSYLFRDCNSDLTIKEIRLNRKCQVEVVVQNVGSGKLPDEVWDKNSPLGKTNVLIKISGKKGSGGKTILGFDPTKRLRLRGGTATLTLSSTPWGTISGTAVVQATVDQTNLIRELNEDNNSKATKLTCRRGRKSPPKRRGK